VGEVGAAELAAGHRAAKVRAGCGACMLRPVALVRVRRATRRKGGRMLAEVVQLDVRRR